MFSTTSMIPRSRVSGGAALRPRRGFTLVELLVVIGVIALLMAILLPALGQARAVAQSAKCQAQQRQIIQAMLVHADEHNGYMPLSGEPSPGFDPIALEDPRAEKYDYYGTSLADYHLMSIQGALAAPLGQGIVTESRAALEANIQTGTVRRLFACPADGAGSRIGATVWDGGDAYSSYAFNDAALGWASSVSWDGSGLRSIPYPHRRLRGKVSQFVHPSQLFLLADAVPRADGNWLLFCDGDADLTLRDILVTTIGPPGNPHASMTPPPGLCATWDLIDATRHRGRINVTFADGHGENVRIDERSLARISLNKDFPAD